MTFLLVCALGPSGWFTHCRFWVPYGICLHGLPVAIRPPPVMGPVRPNRRVKARQIPHASPLLDSRSWGKDPAFKILDPGFCTWCPASRVQDLDPESLIFNPGSNIRGPGSWVWDPGFGAPGAQDVANILGPGRGKVLDHSAPPVAQDVGNILGLGRLAF